MLGLVSCRLSSDTMSYEYRNMSFDVVSDTLSDSRYNQLFAPYKDSLEKAMSEVIGKSAMALVSGRPESPLTNLVSDMALEFANRFCKTKRMDIVPQFSLINTGSIRTSLPQGELTLRHAYELMPFENELVLLKLNGRQVIELANYIATRGGEGVAGISFGIGTDRATGITVQGMRIDEEQKYWMITSDYIANGGDGMKVLTWAEKRIGTNVLIRDMIIESLKEKLHNNILVESKNDGRLYHAQ